MNPLLKIGTLALGLIACSAMNVHADIQSKKTIWNLSDKYPDDATWQIAPAETLSLMAQPMAIPKSSETYTPVATVKSIHNDKWIAFKLEWQCDSMSVAGKLAEFSDAVAIQFPKNDGPAPAIFMGTKESPVHILHWRAQYQADVENGKPSMKDLYPNMNPDMYPMEFADAGNVKGLTDEKREIYSPAKAVGNPQSSRKTSAVDEIIAEGFGTSAVIESKDVRGHGSWKDAKWSVVIVRPLDLVNGSKLGTDKENFAAFAIWQGKKGEVGSRKSVTMAWINLQILK